MRTSVWLCAALVSWFLTAATANACWYPTAVSYACCPPPPCCVAYTTQSITCYRPEWRQEKIPITIQKVSYRAETTKVKVTEYVPQWFDQKVQTAYCVPVPKVVSWDATSCVMIPVVMFDPCTCCCYMSCYPQWITRKVQCTVYEAQMRTREDVVKVCRMVPQERQVDQTRMIPQYTQEQSYCVRNYCVMVPYQSSITVPVYLPCCR